MRNNFTCKFILWSKLTCMIFTIFINLEKKNACISYILNNTKKVVEDHCMRNNFTCKFILWSKLTRMIFTIFINLST